MKTTIFITGTSRDIGKALALYFSSQGATVIGSSRKTQSELASRTQEEIDQLDFSRYNPKATTKDYEERIQYLETRGISTENLSGKENFNNPEDYKTNIENFIGMAQIPVGLAGPILINASNAQCDFFVPLATNEGALIAFYTRGMKACRLSGGNTNVCLSEGVQRSPFFRFNTIHEAQLFIHWIQKKTGSFSEIVSETGRYAKLKAVRHSLEGNIVIV